MERFAYGLLYEIKSFNYGSSNRISLFDLINGRLYSGDLHNESEEEQDGIVLY